MRRAAALPLLAAPSLPGMQPEAPKPEASSVSDVARAVLGSDPVSDAELLRLVTGCDAERCLAALEAHGGIRGMLLCPRGALLDAGWTDVQVGRLVAMARVAQTWHTEPLKRGTSFRSAADIFRGMGPRMRDLRHEEFRVVTLDGKHRVIADRLISQGTLTSSPVHPREVFRPVIGDAAAAVVLVHNHPSGDPSPSGDDLEITRRLCEVGQLLGVRVVDHVVIGDGQYVSMAERGIMPGQF